MVSMNLLAELVQTGEYRTSSVLLAPYPGFLPEKIAYLAPYEAQFHMACSTQEVIAWKIKNVYISKVKLAKVDGYQRN
jgi:hypothetical protein